MPLVVKNTFLCEVGDDEGQTPTVGQLPPRSKTVHCLDSGAQELLEDGDDDSRLDTEAAAAVAPTWPQLRDALPQLAFEEQGCGLLLEALGGASREELRAAAGAMRGSVRLAARSPHAHQLLEHFLHNLGSDEHAFIAEELLGDDGLALAFDVSGSSVLCCLLLFSAGPAVASQLVGGILSGAGALCHHKNGHHVALSILEHGSREQRRQIASVLCEDAGRTARHRFAAQVLSEALLQCEPAVAAVLAEAVLSKPGTATALACHCFGVNVVRSLVRLPQVSQAVMQELKKAQKKLSKDKFGSALITELGLSPLPATANWEEQTANRGGA